MGDRFGRRTDQQHRVKCRTSHYRLLVSVIPLLLTERLVTRWASTVHYVPFVLCFHFCIGNVALTIAIVWVWWRLSIEYINWDSRSVYRVTSSPFNHSCVQNLLDALCWSLQTVVTIIYDFSWYTAVFQEAKLVVYVMRPDPVAFLCALAATSYLYLPDDNNIEV